MARRARRPAASSHDARPLQGQPLPLDQHRDGAARGTCEQVVEGCARAGIPAISRLARQARRRWASSEAARLIRDARPRPSPAFAAAACSPAPTRRAAARARRQPPRRRRGRRHRRALPGAGRRRPAAGLAGHRGRARRSCATASPRCCPTRAPPACRSRSSRCIRCTPPTAPASTRSRRRTTSATRSATGIGVAVDVYHVWWDPDLAAQIARAGKGRASSPFTSATGWCRRPTCCSTAA